MAGRDGKESLLLVFGSVRFYADSEVSSHIQHSIVTKCYLHE